MLHENTSISHAHTAKHVISTKSASSNYHCCVWRSYEVNSERGLNIRVSCLQSRFSRESSVRVTSVISLFIIILQVCSPKCTCTWFNPRNPSASKQEQVHSTPDISRPLTRMEFSGIKKIYLGVRA